MLYVGLDLHKKYTEYAVMDIAGNVQRQGRVENTLDKMREFSESVPPRSSMVIESSSTWYWAHRLLSQRHDVMLSNPIKNKAIASAKLLKIVYWVLKERWGYHSLRVWREDTIEG